VGEETDRPQDAGRPHRRVSIPEPETARILEAYRDAMRAELEETLGDIRPDAGQLTIGGGVARPELAERVKLWDLAIKLARELGRDPVLELGDPPAPPPVATDGAARRGRAPRISARDRKRIE
jgi:hypothetical protein